MRKPILSLKKLSAIAALGAVGLGFAGAAHAVSFNSAFFANRNNTVGTTFINMTPQGTTFCYLGEVEFEETDAANESALCRVTKGPVVWTLEATLGASSDADVHCLAVCYNN
jgi:hypothetical protein